MKSRNFSQNDRPWISGRSCQKKDCEVDLHTVKMSFLYDLKISHEIVYNAIELTGARLRVRGSEGLERITFAAYRWRFASS